MAAVVRLPHSASCKHQPRAGRHCFRKQTSSSLKRAIYPLLECDSSHLREETDLLNLPERSLSSSANSVISQGSRMYRRIRARFRNTWVEKFRTEGSRTFFYAQIDSLFLSSVSFGFASAAVRTQILQLSAAHWRQRSWREWLRYQSFKIRTMTTYWQPFLRFKRAPRF